MKVLLDTHAFLWWIADSDHPRLSQRAKETIADKSNEMLFSAASGWELAIKHSLGRLEVPELQIPEEFEQFVSDQTNENGFEMLPITLGHAVSVYRLPHHHKDPYDRLLIAQSIALDIPIVSIDSKFAPYSVSVIW